MTTRIFRSFGRQLGTKAMPTNTTHILYDIPGTATKHQSTYGKPGMRLSLPRRTNRCTYDTCKRAVLNYKQIHHRTEWVEFPDIAEVAKCIGAPHTFLRRGGKPLHTVPILHDPATDRCLSGSLQIAFNLEHLHPHLPKLFLTDFDDKFLRSVVTVPL
jgi:hypothetical protein